MAMNKAIAVASLIALAGIAQHEAAAQQPAFNAKSALAGKTVTCGEWRGRYVGNEPGIYSEDFKPAGPVVLTVSAEGRANVQAPQTFPTDLYPASPAQGPGAMSFDGNTLVIRKVQQGFIENFIFLDLDSPKPRLKWQRVRMADTRPGEIYLDVGCSK